MLWRYIQNSPRGLTISSSVCSSLRDYRQDEDKIMKNNKRGRVVLPTPTTSVCRAPSTASNTVPSTRSILDSQGSEPEVHDSARSSRGCNKKRSHRYAFSETSDYEQSEGSSNLSTWVDDQSSSDIRSLGPKSDTAETYAETLPKLDPGHPFANQDITNELTDIFLEEFSSRRFTTSTTQPQGRKRTKHSSPFSSHQSAGPLRSGDRCAKADDDGHRLFFACPFYRHNPQNHITCNTRHCLLTLHDVREHLCLAHRRPPFCPVCYCVFETYMARDQHVRMRDCPLRSPVAIEGLTVAQLEELEEMNEVEEEEEAENGTVETAMQITQWHEIWRVVFPDLPSDTASPCLSTKRERRVYELRRSWSRHGQRIISDVLERRELKSYSIENEERNLEALFCFAADYAVDRMIASELGPA